MILCLDFETVDPYISRKMGSGWVYGMVNPESDFKVLGASIKEVGSNKQAVYETGKSGMSEIFANLLLADGLVMHNAQYDFGCLLYQFSNDLQEAFNLNIFDLDIYDTKVMSHLDNSSRMSHGLDDLGKELFGVGKDLEILRTAAYKANLKPWTQKELMDKKRAQKKELPYIRQRPSDSILNRLAIQNLDKLPEDVVGHYCNRDVELTERLYQHFMPKLDNSLVLKYSNLAKVCCKNRIRGVPIDKKALTYNSTKLDSLIKEQEATVYQLSNSTFNIHSSKETVEVLSRSGIECPLTDKGNPSATTPWLERRTEPLCKAIVKARQSYKVGNDFLTGVQNRLLMTNTNGTHLYPELNILQARTGRFSSKGPNIQQIPADPIYGKMCREIYYCGGGLEDNIQFHSLDYSNQEGRLQLHYAIKLGCEGAVEIGRNAQHFDWDMHLDIARLIWGTSVSKGSQKRTLAKAINFGLSYGMGIASLSKQIEVDEKTARKLVKEYYKAAPYLKELINKTKHAMMSRGYIKTIGGRTLTIDPPSNDKTFEYKALNKLIQGSAADQTIAAMVQADLKSLPVLFPVHDELDMIGTIGQALQLKHIMETCTKLVVPVVVTLNSGKSWGDCK